MHYRENQNEQLRLNAQLLEPKLRWVESCP